MAERKMRYAVLTYFEKYVKVGNKAAYQWDADGLLESYSYDEIKDVIDYAASVDKKLQWRKFLYSFDDYRSAMVDAVQDRAQRRRNIERVREWMSE